MVNALDIRKQLIRIAKEAKRSSQEVLQYYAMERFLYRLSVSDYNNRFIFPTILELSAPRLLGYTQESVVAEKVDAMLQLGELNSRMKDFYDIWYLAHRISFKMNTLSEALKATLITRKTEVPKKPHIFDRRFWTNSTKQEQWKNFCNQNRFEDMPEFSKLMAQLEEFLSPVLQGLAGEQNEGIKWLPDSFIWKG